MIKQKIKQELPQIKSAIYFLFQRVLVTLKLKRYIYARDVELWRRGLYFDWDYKQIPNSDSYILINYLEAENESTKKNLKESASRLSKKHKILLHDVQPEMGGAGGPGITGNQIFDYIVSMQSNPLIIFGASYLGEKLLNGLIDLIRSMYYQNKVFSSKFVIRKNVDDTSYNFIFDGLNAEQAIAASKKIPTNIKLVPTDGFNQNLYFKFNAKDQSWKQLKYSL